MSGKIWRYMFIAMLCLSVCYCFGADAETVDLTKSAIPAWVSQAIYLVLSSGVLAMGGYVTYCGASLLNQIFGKNWEQSQYADAIEALRHGIQVAEEQVRSELMSDTASGNLTLAQVNQLKAHAYTAALAVAEGPGLKLLETWGADQIGTMISRLIQGTKPTVVVTTPITPPALLVHPTEGVKWLEAPKPTPVTIVPTKPAVIVEPPKTKPTPEEIKTALELLQRANQA